MTVRKLSQREGYAQGLLELGAVDPQVVVLDSDLSKATRTDLFAEKFPARFVDVGICEQDLIGTAAGLALNGKIPFATAYGVFVAGRSWDQIRTTVCYSELNVKVVGANAGISGGAEGATHQALEDIAVMRVLPNMKIIVPCDAVEAKKATVAAAAVNGPCYLRFAREDTPVFTDDSDPFAIGKANTLRKSDGDVATIIACGPIVYEALLAYEQLKTEGVAIRVINMHTVKPLDELTVAKAATETGAIVTAELHQVTGGLGGAVAEYLAKNKLVPLEMVGLQDAFAESGSPVEIAEKYGLSAKGIAAAVRRVLQRKAMCG